PACAVCSSVKNTTQGRDLNGEIVLLDRQSRPGGPDQRLLGDRFSGPFEQRPEHRNSTSAELGWLVIAQQRFRCSIETEQADRGCFRHRSSENHSTTFSNFFRTVLGPR